MPTPCPSIHPSTCPTPTTPLDEKSPTTAAAIQTSKEEETSCFLFKLVCFFSHKKLEYVIYTAADGAASSFDGN
jgi:hypothetical protein